MTSRCGEDNKACSEMTRLGQCHSRGATDPAYSPNVIPVEPRDIESHPERSERVHNLPNKSYCN